MLVDMKRISCIAILLVSGHLTPQTAGAEVYGSGWYRELQFSVSGEDNVPRSYKPEEQISDTVTAGSVGLGYSSKLGDRTHGALGGYVSASRHERFDALDHTAVSLAGEISWQPQVRFDRPWYRFNVDVTRLDYEDSDAREGYLATAGASINQRFGMRAIGHLGYRYLDLISDKTGAEAARDAAFDVDRHEIFAGVDYHLMDGAWIAFEYSFQHGSFTSSSSDATSTDTKHYDASTRDYALDRCSPLPCGSYYAYRNAGDVHTVDAALLFPLGPIDVDLSAQWYRAVSGGGFEYRNAFVHLGLLWTF